jgi:hypothetical protein
MILIQLSVSYPGGGGGVRSKNAQRLSHSSYGVEATTLADVMDAAPQFAFDGSAV